LISRFIFYYSDNRIIKRFFSSYDKGNKGYLDRSEAVEYIQDLLKISGYDKEISNQAKKTQTEQKGYYDDYGINNIIILTFYFQITLNLYSFVHFSRDGSEHGWNNHFRTIN